MSDLCDNKLLKRLSSPDGKLILATYHRECSSKIYTTAAIEKPSGFLQTKGEVVCYLISWGDRHSVEAEWKAENNIFISTTDRLEKFDFEGSKESCGNIKISYDVQFRNEQQKTDNSAVIAKMKKALSDIEPCITKYYKSANPNNDVAGDVNKMINNGEHRSAVENILGYAYSARCSISPVTYENFKELSDTFDLKPQYLERVAALSKN
jgi:hypothetical protein